VLTCGLWASTVMQVSFQEMVATSEFIFEGTVIGQEAIRPDGSRNIFTRVTFAVSDVLKGDNDASTVSLYFMGGTIGSLTLSISDLQIPKNGERGIYFVESIAKRQVHPLYGWNQGRFLILNDRDGNPRVHTAKGEPIRSVGKTATPTVAALLDGATAAALGVEVAADSAGVESVLTPGAFKQRIRDIGGLQ
ncbi:MAG: hypothetical protein OXH92_06015, partial [Bryobacterales bacterium]|nr:hypothetical protein [Bryobacterales bacterium]